MRPYLGKYLGEVCLLNPIGHNGNRRFLIHRVVFLCFPYGKLYNFPDERRDTFY